MSLKTEEELQETVTKYLKDRKQKNIAEVMGIKQQSVSSRMTRIDKNFGFWHINAYEKLTGYKVSYQIGKNKKKGRYGSQETGMVERC